MADPPHPPGKDAGLKETIDRATALLEAMEMPTETVSWQNPAPDCWSVHLRAVDCRLLATNGKGTSKAAALASALGEFFERLATTFFFADYYLGDLSEAAPFFFYPDEVWFPHRGRRTIPGKTADGKNLLNSRLRKFYNPEGRLGFFDFLDGNSNSENRGICTLPFTNLNNGQQLYFPVSLLNDLYVSNGMAAGNSASECGSQALSEIIERHVKNSIISQGICLPDVPADHLRRYPRLLAILDRLAENGLTVRVKDGSLGGRFPVICALLTNTVDGGVYAAFGANVRFETAIERTLTELLQGRNLADLHHFQPPCHDISLVADPYNLESHFVDSDGLLAWTMFGDKADFPFSPWDFHGSTAEEFAFLQALLQKLGADIFRAEYHHLGMYSCRIVIPGISEIYPIDDLGENNRAAAAALRSELLRLPKMDPAGLAKMFDHLESLNLYDHQLIATVIGIAFDIDSPWSSLSIGELKSLLLLAMENHQEAIHWCSWVLDHGDLPPSRKRLFRLLHALLGLSLAGQEAGNYSNILNLLYSEEELRHGKAIVDGDTTFPGLVFGGSWPEISKEHAKLLQLYEKVNLLKIKEKIR